MRGIRYANNARGPLTACLDRGQRESNDGSRSEVTPQLPLL
jgi:hypothetical protein